MAETCSKMDHRNGRGIYCAKYYCGGIGGNWPFVSKKKCRYRGKMKRGKRENGINERSKTQCLCSLREKNNLIG